MAYALHRENHRHREPAGGFHGFGRFYFLALVEDRLFSDEHLAAIAAVALIVGVPGGILVRWVWDRWWRRSDADDEKSSKALVDHGARLIVVEKRIDAVELRDSERQKAIGRLETDQTRLEGKVGGLQDFWRSEFSKLRQELREDQEAFRRELREDQANTEQRLTALLTAHREEERSERQQHQQRVHDRLNTIAADQAKLLTEFVDTVVERKTQSE